MTDDLTPLLVSDIAMTDEQARTEALNTRGSYIVQAPAGSGKTELLIRRYLKLLGEVEAPEQILAITFTRAATAEMRNRILRKLEEVAAQNTPQHTDPESTEALALGALRNAAKQGWKLLEQPHRLRIETIDSFCLSLAHKTPRLARLGGTLSPAENPSPMLATAARRTLRQLDNGPAELREAVKALMELRDNNLGECQDLITKMLERRDQWSQALGFDFKNDEQTIRRRLEAPMKRDIERTLERAHVLLADGEHRENLLRLAKIACRNLRSPQCARYEKFLDQIEALDTLNEHPGSAVEDLDAWRAVAALVLTKDGDWRKALDVRQGFPARSEEKADFIALMAQLVEVDGLLEILGEITSLPPAEYSSQQWNLLRHFFTALRHATAELRVVFAEQNAVDFVEVGMAAQEVLRHIDPDLGDLPSDLALAASERLKHLLVDEFQDTSRGQHSLLTQLIRGWSSGEGHTCFVVGDPMQSIYAFRQAEVELFLQTLLHGLRTREGHFALDPLRLKKNFRSDRELVAPLNEVFGAVFGGRANSGDAVVEFAAAEATHGSGNALAYRVHADFLPSRADAEERKEASEREARAMLEVIEQHQPRIRDCAASGEEYRVAVLGRAKKHLLPIASALRKANIPFRAVELENLGERQEILDLTALVRALLHPMDRVAWLSVLRAPWCGLQLRDLHTLCGGDDHAFARTPMLELLLTRSTLLKGESQRRAGRTTRVMQAALATRHRASLASWIERTWHTLGGPLCVDAAGRENAELFFQMLDELPEGEIDCLADELQSRLNRLWAQPDPTVSERCGVQLMSIHKAKGLGFEVVLVPSLDRKPSGDRAELLSWLERASPAGEPDGDNAEILVAPIGVKGENSDLLRKWVRRQKATREAEERKRLLYVACTRARHELHLFGVATEVDEGTNDASAPTCSLKPGDSQSLLSTGWPGLATEFLRQWTAHRANVIPFPATANEDVPVELAASSDEGQPGSNAKPWVLKRLPEHLLSRAGDTSVTITDVIPGEDADGLFHRPEGSVRARAFGTTVHVLMERVARSLEAVSLDATRKLLANWKPQAAAMLLRSGMSRSEADSQAAEAIRAATAALDHDEGRWLLSPHPGAKAEQEWSAWLEGRVRTLRADRVFRAGAQPLAEGSDVFWIIDYKTAAHSAAGVEDFLRRQRETYEPQLTIYAEILRKVEGDNARVRLGLYYPLLQKLTWWTA